MSMSFSTGGQTQCIDLTHLPTTQVDKGSRGAGVFLMVFACLWGGLPTLAMIHLFSSGKFQAPALIGLVFGVIGIGMFIGGLYLLSCSTTTMLSLQQVSVTRKSIFGIKQWSAPLSSFTGIRSRSEYHSGSKNSPSYTLHIVELLHDDPKQAVCLYQSRMDNGIRGIWENACRVLNLPAVEGEGAHLIIRAVEDLEKSVKDLARE